MEKKNRKNLRRRSNWYIYLISFAATFMLLGLVVLAMRDVLFPGMGISTWDKTRGDYVPDEALDVTVLFMLSDEHGGVPGKFMMLNYRPRDGVITVVPLNAKTRVKSGRNAGTLTELYSQGGAQRVSEGIKDEFGVECGFYAQFDRSSFTEFVNLLGEVSVDVPFNFSSDEINLSAGEHKLTGDELFIYMSRFNSADYPQAGEDYDLVIMGSAITTLLNSNCRNKDSDAIQNSFNKILNNATTNLSFKDYTEYQQALLYTSKNSVNPAVYIIPSGEYESDKFVASNQSVADILSKFGIAG
jgi:anionic cell wall polymer biosynthesis LytR-Cps2A-Psr (LCP) family protein